MKRNGDSLSGLFGLSTKDPYTIMLCPLSLALASVLSSSMNTSPSHRVKHTNFIFDIHMHLCLQHMHIMYLVILTCNFKWQPCWYFSLICCPAHIDSNRLFIVYTCVCISSLSSYTKGIMPL